MADAQPHDLDEPCQQAEAKQEECTAKSDDTGRHDTGVLALYDTRMT